MAIQLTLIRTFDAAKPSATLKINTWNRHSDRRESWKEAQARPKAARQTDNMDDPQDITK